MKAASVFNGTSSLETPIGDDSDIFIKDIIVDDKVKSPESITEIIRTNLYRHCLKLSSRQRKRDNQNAFRNRRHKAYVIRRNRQSS